MSYFVLDGLVMNNPVNYNGIQIDHCDHCGLKNIQSRTQTSPRRSQSAYKMAGCSDYLFFNNSATQWSTCGVDQVGCKNGLLMNNNYFEHYASCNADAASKPKAAPTISASTKTRSPTPAFRP